jgi:hypothetical protein
MRRALLGLLALVALAPATARGQEPPEIELEFVRKLRAKGYADLAKEYLDGLAKRKDQRLAAALPMEQARTLLAIAREKDPEQRFAAFNQAREFLRDYTARNDGKPESAQGTLELARLSTYEGQALLTKALRDLDVEAQQDLARPAEEKFKKAGEELDAAIKLLQGFLEDAKVPDDVKKQLRAELTQARFDKGANFIEQARTYVNKAREDVNEKRAKIIVQAQKMFEELKDDDALSIRMQANAWLMKIAMEQTAPDLTEKYYKRVTDQKDPDAKAGQRLVRLFDMQDVLTNGKNPRGAKVKSAEEKLHLVQKMGQDWLKEFAALAKSPEGQAVTWELANAYLAEAQDAREKEKKDKKLKVTSEGLFEKAQKYFVMLTQTEGEFTERANKINLSISFERMGDRKDFHSFDEFYLKAQFDALKMQEVASKRAKAREEGKADEAEKYDKEWHDLLKGVARTLVRAISLSDEHTPVQKLDEARYLLVSAYLLTGDLRRAAVAGDALARARPPTRRAPAGAGYAIDAYANLLNQDNSDGTRRRLQDLIEYVLLPENQKLWGGDPVSAVARYQLAMIYNRDGDYKKAIEQLANLPREFPAYLYAQGQLVFIALQALQENQNLSEPERNALKKVVRDALARMPDLPDSADPTTAYMFFEAQIEKSKLMYADAAPFLKQGEPLKAAQQYRELGKFVSGLEARLDKLPIKLTTTTRERLELQLHGMQKYAKLGLAEVEYREGHFDKVLETTKPTVDAVRKADDGKGAIKLKDYKVTGEILGLALRAEVQKGNVQEGKAILNLLKRVTAESEEKAGTDKASDVIIRGLLTEISLQVADLKSQGKENKLKEVVKGFSAFLDELLKDTDPAKMSRNEIQMLAAAFAGLERHDKAAAMYAAVPQPKVMATKKALKAMTDDEMNELRNYWTVRLDYVQELRRGKEYEPALKVIGDWLNHPQALLQYYAMKEKNLILEDMGKFGAATLGWNEFMKSLAPRANDASAPQLKRLYFEGYFFGTRTLVKYAQNDPKVKNKDSLIQTAAKRIVDLEFAKARDGWEIAGPMFEQLLPSEPELKTAYDKLKKNR